jgi:hypothetical protein
MDTLGFKFTFYKREPEKLKENREGEGGKMMGTARFRSQPRTALAQMQNIAGNFRVVRPVTQRNERAVEKRRPNSRTPIEVNGNSLEKMIESWGNSKQRSLSTSRNPRSYNIIRLLPVIHRHKTGRYNGMF